jgi:squalene-hopene/tetraprenyl-beta-curcumene cyclase
MSTTNLETRVRRAKEKLLGKLRELQTSDGHWTGRLSTSALSTATAVSALSLSLRAVEARKTTASSYDSSNDSVAESPSHWKQLAQVGCQWLSNNQNKDGGFGDTERSHSNIATTYLVLAAWELAGFTSQVSDQAKAAWSYVERQGGWDGLRRRYGKDKTFVVPILTNCALAGLVPWNQVPNLPFEAAALPQSWYRLAKMPVVSYAIPALVAMGQAKFHFAPTRNPVSRLLRNLSAKRTLGVLQRMQPESGGYLEAVPLTSFVLMSLAGMGLDQLPVSRACRKFLIDSVLADGSWPIDTNLATWVTSLTTRVILKTVEESDAEGQGSDTSLVTDQTIEWLLSCQHRVRHPFTGADPGGWGWTDLSGAVPDADDTPAALIALECWYRRNRTHTLCPQIESAVALGLLWLLGLQNRDGGWPTFCRGWGQLPFDRSGSDLTAHALRALDRWLPYHAELSQRVPLPSKSAFDTSIKRGMRYLEKTQFPDGSWLPLWFGNQDRPEEDNPVYGTSRVLLALCEMKLTNSNSARRGRDYLMRNQNADGGWGGGPSIDYGKVNLSAKHDSQPVTTSPSKTASTIEETALALEAVLQFNAFDGLATNEQEAITRALSWLCDAVDQDWTEQSWPIGFYFAKLWYHEQMYPITFSLSALTSAERAWAKPAS